MRKHTRSKIKHRLRLGAFAIALGLIGLARADTQNEKGDAGDNLSTAEVFDCKKDKWQGVHATPSDCDLICFYWKGGAFTCELDGVISGDIDGMILLFDSSGKCVASEESVIGNGKETMFLPSLSKGVYYLYGGYWNVLGFHNLADYTSSLNAYCGAGIIRGNPGPLYGCKSYGAPATPHVICFPGYSHVGVPFQQAAKAGTKLGNTKGGGSLKVMSSRRKAKFFCECRNPSDQRGATGVKFRGVSKKKFKQKYIDIGAGENLTAELIKNNFCRNYDPGFKQTFKCTMTPKGRFKKMSNVKSKCVLDCTHDEGETKDTKKVIFYANLKK